MTEIVQPRLITLQHNTIAPSVLCSAQSPFMIKYLDGREKKDIFLCRGDWARVGKLGDFALQGSGFYGGIGVEKIPRRFSCGEEA
jgi:hypothetical protein